MDKEKAVHVTNLKALKFSRKTPVAEIKKFGLSPFADDYFVLYGPNDDTLLQSFRKTEVFFFDNKIENKIEKKREKKEINTKNIDARADQGTEEGFATQL